MLPVDLEPRSLEQHFSDPDVHSARNVPPIKSLLTVLMSERDGCETYTMFSVLDSSCYCVLVLASVQSPLSADIWIEQSS